LRALDHGEKLVDLLSGGRRGIALLDSTDQAAQLGNFLRAFPGIEAEKSDQQDEAYRKRFVAVRERANRIPRNDREDDGENEEKEESQAPEFALAFFKLFEAVRYRRAP